MDYSTEVKTIIDRVTDYGPKPRSAREALVQAHALLSEEGRWISGSWFVDGDPGEAFENASCDSWRACSLGAIGLVTGDMPIRVTKETENFYAEGAWRDAVASGETTASMQDWLAKHDLDFVHYSFNIDDEEPEFHPEDTPVAWRAAQFLAYAICLTDNDDEEDIADTVVHEPASTVIAFNDSQQGMKGRTKVLKAFEKAIELAAKGRLP